jgi:hypothetical protein
MLGLFTEVNDLRACDQLDKFKRNIYIKIGGVLVKKNGGVLVKSGGVLVVGTF